MKSFTLVVLIFSAASLAAQPPANFDAASIKLSGPNSVRGSNGGPGSRDPGRYTFNKATLLDLIWTAYNVKDFQVSSGAPLDRDQFDLAVTIPSGATMDQFRTMLQRLLGERFHLRAHIVSKDFQTQELVIARNGLLMKVWKSDAVPALVQNDSRFPELPPGKPGFIVSNSLSGPYTIHRARAQQQPISALVQMLKKFGEPPLVDGTGLTNLYDFTLEYSTVRSADGASENASVSEAPELVTALQQQLGLQLVPKKVAFLFWALNENVKQSAY